jgi:hypothetical protein
MGRAKRRKPRKRKAVYPQVLVIVEGGLVQDVIADRKIEHGVLDWDGLDEDGAVYPESFIRWIVRRGLLEPDVIAEVRRLNAQNAAHNKPPEKGPTGGKKIMSKRTR